tara:strand:+ start:148 stop:693 length:546 start_codon:yes stop_codon:yes gene_type:complete
MANSMYTWVSVDNLTNKSKKELIELLSPESGSSSLDATTFSNRYFVGKEPTENYDLYSFRIDEYGAKWWYVNDVDNFIDNDISFTIESAWSVPQELLKKLRNWLIEESPDVVIRGTYEDESYEPIGAFIYAKDYDDIEDCDIDINHDKLFEDDEYRESIDEERINLSDTLFESYNTTKKED